ncbi:MAG: TRAP transporter large permease [Rhodospirillales bacterium]
MIITPLVLLLLGFPIFIILLATSAIVLLFFMNVPTSIMHQVMFGSVDKFALLAVPYFIFAGEVMSQGGISRRLVEFTTAVFGGLRGNLAYATVGTSEMMGAMSGSSPATVAAVGKLLYNPLIERGYGEKFTAGLICSSGAIAIIIPPSISMILYGASAEQSVAHLFVGGIFPGLLIGLLLAIYIYFYAHKNDISDADGFSWGRLWRTSKSAVWALGTPGIILGGIYLGVFSPTEAAGMAGVYAVIVAMLVYRELDIAGLWRVAVASMYLTAQVTIIVAAAGVFSWLLTVSGVPQSIVALIQSLNMGQIEVLLVVNVLLLIVGALIDPASAILILTPLLVPVMKAVDVNLIHFGIIMTVNLAIGMFTPPFGLNIFICQALFRVKLTVLYPGLVPFIIINIIALVLVTYVPWISMYLTKFV